MHIINQSSLIELYRLVHVNIDDNFFITRRTRKHATPRMEIMMKRVIEKIQAARDSKEVEALNALDEGMAEWSAADMEEEMSIEDDATALGMGAEAEMELFEDDFGAI